MPVKPPQVVFSVNHLPCETQSIAILEDKQSGQRMADKQTSSPKYLLTGSLCCTCGQGMTA